MENPLVSFIVRTIPGRGALLSAALASIVAQTVRQFEIIVVEDGGETARAIVAAAPQVRYLSLPRVGRCKAGNAGLAAARGVYCCFLDDDDEVYPHHVETLLPLLESGAPAAFALADIRYSDAVTEPPRAAPPFWTLRKHNIMPIQAVVFRRALFLAHGGLAEDLDHFEDWELWLRYASRGGAFAITPEVTSFYRMPSDVKSYYKRVVTAAQYYPVVAARVKDYPFANGGTGLMPLSPLVRAKASLLQRYAFFALWHWLKRKKLFFSSLLHRF